jgi:hypothetical protein
MVHATPKKKAQTYNYTGTDRLTYCLPALADILKHPNTHTGATMLAMTRLLTIR